MPDCQTIDPFVTPYVDGELPDADRLRVDEHLRRCPPCRSRVSSERAVRDLIRERRSALAGDAAPPALRAACTGIAARERPSGEAAAAGRGVAAGRRWWPARFAPAALAAALVLFVGGAFLFRLTESSVDVMAAELAADHVKCFALNRVLGTEESAATVQSSMLSHFGWTLHLPQNPQRAGLELVGARPCLYGEGRVAHLMYRHHGVPVSVFMLPRSARPEELVEVLGHQAAVWSSGSRTFVLIAREPRAEVEQMAAFVQASLR
ncbi:MAG TPA: zf-HC2 domain-containing protein [Vicinamibacterales bacterium]|jgi:anti-sigma factor RsiW|nr:zf-HC2 domain-containing protein [Vicinamibacterales bacterium]